MVANGAAHKIAPHKDHMANIPYRKAWSIRADAVITGLSSSSSPWASAVARAGKFRLVNDKRQDHYQDGNVSRNDVIQLIEVLMDAVDVSRGVVVAQSAPPRPRDPRSRTATTDRTSSSSATSLQQSKPDPATPQISAMKKPLPPLKLPAPLTRTASQSSLDKIPLAPIIPSADRQQTESTAEPSADHNAHQPVATSTTSSSGCRSCASLSARLTESEARVAELTSKLDQVQSIYDQVRPNRIIPTSLLIYCM